MPETDPNRKAATAPHDTNGSSAHGAGTARSSDVLAAGLALVIGAIVLFAHWPVLSAGTISLDDTQYLFENPVLQHPGWTSAKRALGEVLESSTVEGYYEPLTLISLMFDVALGGRKDDLTAFHRTSLALHVFNTMLIVALLHMLVGDPWAAAMAALLFGVHPLTIEPVAWVWERKTLLAAFFALPCLIAYVRYVRTGNRGMYAVSLAGFVLALLAKPTVTPLPALLLLLDFWPLKRILTKGSEPETQATGGNAARRSNSASAPDSRGIPSLLIEKLPFFFVAGISAVITVISTARNSGIISPTGTTLLQMPLKISYLLVFYLGKILWPTRLSLLYMLPEPMALSQPIVLAAVVGTCLLGALLVISLRWTRALFVGALFFVLAISPTLGFIGYSWINASDKYVYLPVVGLLVVLAKLLQWGRGTAPARWAAPACVALAAGAEILATRNHIPRWRETEVFYRYTLGLAPNAAVLHNNLGFTLMEKGRREEAEAEYVRTLELDPNFDCAHSNLGQLLAERGEVAAAEAHCRKALQIRPKFPEALNNLGLVLEQVGRIDESMDAFHRALRIRPEYAEAHNNLANTLITRGNFGEAIDHYRQALAMKPDYAAAHCNLGFALSHEGEFEEAIRHCEEALRLNPNSPQAHSHLAEALAGKGRTDDAVAHYTKAIEISPGFFKANAGLANIRAGQGQIDDAIAHYRAALRRRSDWLPGHKGLAALLRTQMQWDEAIAHLEEVARLQPKDPQAHTDLADALLRQGRSEQAVQHYAEAVRLDADCVPALNNLAWIRATAPNARAETLVDAVRLAEHACELTKHTQPDALDTLAAAYAAAGQFPEAVKAAKTAIGLATAANRPKQAQAIARRLQLYEARRPYREEPQPTSRPTSTRATAS